MSERNIVAQLHSKMGLLWTRRFARLDTAIPRATQLLMLEGQPGNVVEFSHAVTGLQLGTIKLRVGGKMVTDYIWDD